VGGRVEAKVHGFVGRAMMLATSSVARQRRGAQIQGNRTPARTVAYHSIMIDRNTYPHGTVAMAVAAALLVAVWQGDMLPVRGSAAGTALAAEVPRAPASPAEVRWLPGRVVEGTMFSLIVEGGEPHVVAASGHFAGEPLHFTPDGQGVLTAMAAAPLDSAGPRVVVVETVHADGSSERREVVLPVISGEYRMERLSVAPQFGQPQPEAIQRRIREEAARARAVSERAHATPRMWELPFVAPRESRITSGFGHGRTFNGQVQSRHTGTDYAGAVGAPIRAPARGVVALVDDFYLGGGVIYIDHGAGLVTGYLHLSGKDVKQGDVVERGQVIGRVGATGRVTGPHLHWIVRYGGHTVDALTLLGYRTR
jgi:murein DD-endopeptidase MepM/ murein hydrolase activator NlpD